MKFFQKIGKYFLTQVVRIKQILKRTSLKERIVPYSLSLNLQQYQCLLPFLSPFHLFFLLHVSLEEDHEWILLLLNHPPPKDEESKDEMVKQAIKINLKELVERLSKHCLLSWQYFLSYCESSWQCCCIQRRRNLGIDCFC